MNRHACKEGERCGQADRCVTCYAELCAHGAPADCDLAWQRELDRAWHERLTHDAALRLRFEVAYARARDRSSG